MRKISVSDEICSFFEQKYELKLFGCFVLIKITCKTCIFWKKCLRAHAHFEFVYIYSK